MDKQKPQQAEPEQTQPKEEKETPLEQFEQIVDKTLSEIQAIQEDNKNQTKIFGANLNELTTDNNRSQNGIPKFVQRAVDYITLSGNIVQCHC